jgi:hypothetical protein
MSLLKREEKEKPETLKVSVWFKQKTNYKSYTYMKSESLKTCSSQLFGPEMVDLLNITWCTSYKQYIPFSIEENTIVAYIISIIQDDFTISNFIRHNLQTLVERRLSICPADKSGGDLGARFSWATYSHKSTPLK